MTETIERVARAICCADGRDPDDLRAVYEDKPRGSGGRILLPVYKSDWERYLKQARAAIEAIERHHARD